VLWKPVPPKPSQAHLDPGVRKSLLWAALLFGSWFGLWIVDYLAALLALGHPDAGPLGFFDHVLGALQLGGERSTGDGPWALVGARVSHPAAYWLAATLLVALLAVALTVVVLRPYRGLPPWLSRVMRRQPAPPRDSHWASRGEMARIIIRRAMPGRPTVGDVGPGRLIAPETMISTLLMGSTRSGKTVGVVIPVLLHHRGPVVSTTTKAEIVAAVAGKRQRCDGPVWVYDPAGASDYPCVHYNPIGSCLSFDRSVNFAQAIVNTKTKMGGNSTDWEYWANMNIKLISAAAYSMAWQGKSVIDLRTAINRHDVAGIEEGITRTPEAARALEELDSVRLRDPREVNTIFATCSQAFMAFMKESVAESASVSHFSPAELLDSNGTLFIISPPSEQRALAPLFCALIMDIVQTVRERALHSSAGRIEPSLLMALDEVANIAPIEELPNIATNDAGLGCTLLTAIQSVAQLRERWGADQADILLSGHPFKMILGGSHDPSTLEYGSKLIGEQKVVDVQHQFGANGTITSSSVRPLPLAPADVIRQIPQGQFLGVYRDIQPFLGNQHRFDIVDVDGSTRVRYRDKTLRGLYEMPYVPGFEFLGAEAGA